MHILQIDVKDKDLNKCYPIDNTSLGPERMDDHQAVVPPCASLSAHTELALLDDRVTSVFPCELRLLLRVGRGVLNILGFSSLFCFNCHSLKSLEALAGATRCS